MIYRLLEIIDYRMYEPIEFTKKTGNEVFTIDGKTQKFKLLDFWGWAFSDLTNNLLRGALAEYIVAEALGISNVRDQWSLWDLEYRGKKIEIKSSSYYQSWKQDKPSHIAFDISESYPYDNPEDKKIVKKRRSDLYVFAHLKHDDKKTLNPLELNQWDFYIIQTKTLNEKVPKQKTIGLTSLKKLNPIETNYENLKKTIDALL